MSTARTDVAAPGAGIHGVADKESSLRGIVLRLSKDGPIAKTSPQGNAGFKNWNSSRNRDAGARNFFADFHCRLSRPR